MATDVPRQPTTSLRDAVPDEARSLQEFLVEASRQESRVEQLLADPRKGFTRANVSWSADIDDPEFQKNLRIFHRLITGAVGLGERARYMDIGTVGAAAATQLGCRLDELRRRIILPDDKPLTLTVLLGYRFALEQLLSELGDVPYLRARAAELYAEPESTHVTWRTMFDDKPPLFVDGQQSPDLKEALEDTRVMVAQLLAAKEAQDLPGRARRDLKQRVLLHQALPLVAGVVALFGVAVYLSLGKAIYLPVTAAVAGATLGRLISLRDEVSRGSQVREFMPLFLAQLAVGVITGLVVSLVTNLPVINLGGPNGVAAFSFGAGLSEATFLKLVSKIAGEPNPAQPPKARNDASPSM
jgi:hypothetical protein